MLDANLRDTMRVEIKKLQRQLDTAMVFVTHDQEEAMTLGDTIVIMKDGLIQQVGSPYEIYNEPVNQFVAHFIGSPSTNLIEGNLTLQNDEYWFENEIFSIALPVNDDLDSLTNGQEVTLGVRPQYIELEPEEPLFEAVLNVVESHGPSDAVYLDVNGQPITSVVDQGAVDRSVKAIEVGFTIDKAWIFDRTGERIV